MPIAAKETGLIYFRCHSQEKRLAVERLRRQVKDAFAPLAPFAVVVRRVPSRLQHCASRETEIVVHFSSSCSTRTRMPKPVAQIGSADLEDLRRQLTPKHHSQRS